MFTRGLALIGLTLLAFSAVAYAKPRVALITFQGDPKGEAQDIVAEALSSKLKVVGHKEVNRTVDRLGLEVNDLGERDLKKLENELDVDAIIQAKMSMKGANHLLHFKLFVHGKKQRGFRIEFGSLRSAKFKSKLRDKMVAKIEGDDDGGGRKRHDDDDAGLKDDDNPLATRKSDDDDRHRDKDDDEDRHKRDNDDDRHAKRDDRKGDDDDDDKHRHGKKHTAHRGDDDDDGSLDVEANSDDGDEGPRHPVHAANRVAVRLDVGGGGHQRSLTFTSRAFPQAPNPYKATSPTVRVAAELYPLAFGNPNSVAAGIGVGGQYEQAVGLNARSSAQPGTKFPVTDRSYAAGLRFRIVFGSKPTSPSLTVKADYGRHTVKLNRSALMQGNVIDLPDVDYSGFDPGLEFRIPLVPKVALMFGGGAILLRSAGPIQALTSYGQAKVTGGVGMVGLDILLTDRFAVRVSGEATQIGFAFTGNGAQANNRDLDPTTKDVGGAADRYIGGALTLAVLY